MADEKQAVREPVSEGKSVQELQAEIENLQKSLQIERQNSQMLAETIIRLSMKLVGVN